MIDWTNIEVPMTDGAGTDFLQLHRSNAPEGRLTIWLVDEIRSAIGDERLPAGTPLPPTRILAADLGVSRGVVVEAYQRLTDEGLITAYTGAGTVVTHMPRPAQERARAAEGPTPAIRLPARLGDVEVDLSPGVPDLSAFPRAAWLRAERAVLAEATGPDLGYGDPRGSERLRAQLARWLARTRGTNATAADIIVVAGVAQALTLLAHVLRARGTNTLAVEDPGSRGARDHLEYWGMDTVPISVDRDGMDVRELEGTEAQAAVLTPAHQFPTGVVLAPHRRRALLEWAAAGRLIIEDDYDAEHRYDRAPVPALQGAAPDYVAHTGSTSKTLAPGMRLGWLIPPPHLYAELVAAKHASDLGSPALPQLVLAHLLADGGYDRHIRQVRARQRARRDAVLEAVHDRLPHARVEGVAAGLHVLLTFPGTPAIDDVALADQVRAAGILVHPLSFHRHRPGMPGLVIGYAAHSPDRLREAIARIGSLIRP